MNENKKILVISLYNGSNEVDEVSEEVMKEIEMHYKKCVGCRHDKVVWMGEEEMIVEL